VLSDHEQRALEELERSLAAGPSDAVPPGHPPGQWPARRSGPPGLLAVTAAGCVSALLLVAGVPAAALAIAAATALGWLFWRLWVHRADGGGLAASLLLGAGHGQSGPRRRPGESFREYLRWLSEAE
jgi:hypothetical protein